MSHIVNGHGNKYHGYPKINLDHVARFKPRPSMGGYECFTAQGENLGTVDDYVIETSVTIVPETHHTILIQFGLDENGALDTTRLPIIAWRIDGAPGETPTPICCWNYEVGHCEFCLEIPGENLWVFPGNCIFATFEEAAAEARKHLEDRQKVVARQEALDDKARAICRGYLKTLDEGAPLQDWNLAKLLRAEGFKEHDIAAWVEHAAVARKRAQKAASA